MALPDWLREQKENHFSNLSIDGTENDNLTVKLGEFPYKLTLKTTIHQSTDGRSRSLQMQLFIHNDNNLPTNESSVLSTSIPFVNEESLVLAKNERAYMVDKLFGYIAERLSASLSTKELRQNLSAIIDKYMSRDVLLASPSANVIRPETKATEFIKSSMAQKPEQSQPAQPRKNTQYNKGSGSTPLWKIPPVVMVNFLNEQGVVELVKREPNTTTEDNFYIRIKGQEETKPVKISMVKVPTATKESLRFVFQHNRQGGAGAGQLISELVSSHGLLSEYNHGDPEQVFDNYLKTLTDKPDWSEFNIDLMQSSIQSLGDNAPARQPLSFNPDNKSFNVAKYLLCNWRGLSEERVKGMVSEGIIKSGEFHNVNRNNISSAGFFYYNKFVSADKPIFGEPDGQIGRFQRMMKLKERGNDKLKKFASGGNKGYFAGTPKQGADVLWLTEASLDADSMKDLNDLCRANGIAVVEDNCIALLSTSGLKEFLAQRFGMYVKTQKDSAGNVSSRELLRETRIVSTKDLTSGDQAVLKRYFSTPLHFVSDGTNDADMALSKLKEIATFALGEPPIINVVNEAQQRDMIKGFGEGDGTYGQNKVFDKVSVEEFMINHKLKARYNAGTNSMVWSVDVERFERKPFNSLPKHEIEQIQANAKYVMHELLGVKSIGSAFDNDKAGKEVALELKMLCESIKIPFGTFTPDSMKVELRSKPIFIKDHNDVLMSARGLIAEGRHEECKTLLSSWSNSCKLSPELTNALENKQEVPNGKLTR